MEPNVYFTTKHPVRKTQEHVLAAILLRAMTEGNDIKLPGAISKRLLFNTDIIQDKYIEMFPHLKKIKIFADWRSEACFFTGGVDSFYTLLRHKDKISKCIYVRGYDIRLQDREYCDMVSGRLESVVRDMNKEYIVVETNFRDVFTEIPWATQFGAALASVALTLDCISKVYIPSSGLFPSHGSHPELDPLWSTEAVEIVHDGSGVSRLGKVRFISEHPIALRYLRVCWESKTAYNCGCCEKCVRTLIELYICGVLDKAESFNAPTEAAVAGRIDNLNKLEGYGLFFAKENYEACPEGIIKESLKQLICK